MLRRWLSTICAVLTLSGAGLVSAGTVERRVEVLASTRFADTVGTLQFEGGGSIQLDLTRVEVVDLRHPARPPRRSLKLAPAGSGLVIDLRRDDQGALRFGRVFIAPDRARAQAFMEREWPRTEASR